MDFEDFEKTITRTPIYKFVVGANHGSPTIFRLKSSELDNAPEKLLYEMDAEYRRGFILDLAPDMVTLHFPDHYARAWADMLYYINNDYTLVGGGTFVQQVQRCLLGVELDYVGYYMAAIEELRSRIPTSTNEMTVELLTKVFESDEDSFCWAIYLKERVAECLLASRLRLDHEEWFAALYGVPRFVNELLKA